jgi:hypothetical protein
MHIPFQSSAQEDGSHSRGGTRHSRTICDLEIVNIRLEIHKRGTYSREI